MLSQTIKDWRVLPPERIFVITNAEQREAVLESCPTLLPEGNRRTGRAGHGAGGLAALLVQKEDGDALLPCCRGSRDRGCQGLPGNARGGFCFLGAEDLLVTIGIKPISLQDTGIFARATIESR